MFIDFHFFTNCLARTFASRRWLEIPTHLKCLTPLPKLIQLLNTMIENIDLEQFNAAHSYRPLAEFPDKMNE